MTKKIERWEGDLGPGNNGFENHLFHLNTFEGIGLGGWRIEWKAAKNRLIAVMLELEPKDQIDISLDVDTALRRLGYVKAETAGPTSTELLEVLTALLDRMPAIQDEDGSQLVLHADESPFDPALIARARALIPTPAPEAAL